MKVYNTIVMMVLCCVLSVTAYAQTSHWPVDIYAYQFDMSVFVSLNVNGQPADYSKYEIAAFCSGECRGIAQVQTFEKDEQKNSYGYLRIRSNQQEGETISFKVYNKSAKKEIDVKDVAVTFHSQDVIGLPSNPLLLNIQFLLGDVNNDGELDIADAVCIVNHVVGKSNPVFMLEVADVDGDGEVDIADAVRIVNYIVGKIKEL